MKEAQNPDIANAFFRSGLIESWGRGIERIIKACENNGNPVPEWQVSGGDFWASFPFAYPNGMVDAESRLESRPESGKAWWVSEVSNCQGLLDGSNKQGQQS